MKGSSPATFKNLSQHACQKSPDAPQNLWQCLQHLIRLLKFWLVSFTNYYTMWWNFSQQQSIRAPNLSLSRRSLKKTKGWNFAASFANLTPLQVFVLESVLHTMKMNLLHNSRASSALNRKVEIKKMLYATYQLNSNICKHISNYADAEIKKTIFW